MFQIFEDRSIQLLITKNVVTINSCQHIAYLIICHSQCYNLHYLHLGSNKHVGFQHSISKSNIQNKFKIDTWMEGEVADGLRGLTGETWSLFTLGHYCEFRSVVTERHCH